MIGYLVEAIRPLLLRMSKMIGYVQIFKVQEGNIDKNNKLISFRIDDEKYKAIWNKIEDLKNIELNDLPVYDDRYIKTKIKTYGDKVYTNFRGLSVPKDDIECESLTVISIESLLVYENKYFWQIDLDKCYYNIAKKQMTDYLDENLFED